MTKALRHILPWLVIGMVIIPILSIVVMSVTADELIWLSGPRAILLRYLTTTLWLVAMVAVIALFFGTLTGYLIATFEFPGRRIIGIALFLPLAVPGYLAGYAYVEFFEFAGPLQSGLRQMFGWSSSQDYYFPQIRSLPGAAFVIAITLYPYIYLLARRAFEDQNAGMLDSARTLGSGPLKRFSQVSLPIARPALAAGLAPVIMETLNDFGTVDYFGVQTLTTGIFSIWLDGYDAQGAAQIALTTFAIVILMVAFEKQGRARMRFFGTSRGQKVAQRVQPSKIMKGAVLAFCMLPVLLGFLFPTGVFVSLALTSGVWTGAMSDALANTVTLGCFAAVITCALAGLILIAGRDIRAIVRTLLTSLGAAGYALPGAVLGLGLLVPMIAFENKVADAILAWTGFDPGLFLTGSMLGLLIAFTIRFLALPLGALDAGLTAIAPNLDMAARTLGHHGWSRIWHVYRPLLTGSLAVAGILVFVETTKELPATLLLRPFNFDTLATLAHEQAGLEKIAHAAMPALLIIGISTCVVGILSRSFK